MRVRLITGSMIMGLCLAGCGGAPASMSGQQPPAVVTLPKAVEPPPPTAAGPAPSGSAEPAPTSDVSTTTKVTTGDSSSSTPTSDTGESDTPPDTGDTDCGPITNRAGVTYRLYAEKDESGKTLGCAEADRVMTKYLSLPKDEYQGSGRFANFEGYGCASTPQEREKSMCAKQGISTYITA